MKLLNMKNILGICAVSFFMGACVLDEDATSEQPAPSTKDQELSLDHSTDEIADENTDDKQDPIVANNDTDPTDIDPIEYTIDEAFSLKVGESHLTQQQVTVTFDSVVSDSRCPLQGDVVCFWEGEISIQVQVNIDGKLIETLMTPDYSCSSGSPYLASFTHDDFHLVLESISPESPSPEEGIQQEDYQVKFKVIPTALPMQDDCQVPTEIY